MQNVNATEGFSWCGSRKLFQTGALGRLSSLWLPWTDGWARLCAGSQRRWQLKVTKSADHLSDVHSIRRMKRNTSLQNVTVLSLSRREQFPEHAIASDEAGKSKTGIDWLSKRENAQHQMVMQQVGQKHVVWKSVLESHRTCNGAMGGTCICRAGDLHHRKLWAENFESKYISQILNWQLTTFKFLFVCQICFEKLKGENPSSRKTTTGVIPPVRMMHTRKHILYIYICTCVYAHASSPLCFCLTKTFLPLAR